MRTEAIEQSLQSIGLSEKEARIYISLSGLGSCTAYRIADDSGVKKPTVYIILEELRKKGLILKVPHAKKALFAARNIEEYIHEQEDKLRSARTILPQLHALSKKIVPNVYFFTGLRGLAQASNYKFDSMRGKTYHSFYSSLADCAQEVRDHYKKWDERAIESGISFQIVIVKKDARLFYQYLLDYAKKTDAVAIRQLEKYTYPSNITWEIAADFVRINDEKNMSATIIDDKATADAMRQIFNIVWEKGI